MRTQEGSSSTVVDEAPKKDPNRKGVEEEDKGWCLYR